MRGYTNCYLAERGSCGEGLSGRLLRYMLNDVVKKGDT